MKKALAILLLLSSPAYTQQQPSIDDLRRLVSILQYQRNRAADEVAEANLKIAMQVDEISKLRAELEDLKKKAPADVK